MAVLSDRDIKKRLEEGNLVIEDLSMKNVSIASVDLRLSGKFRCFRHANLTHIDTLEGLNEENMEFIEREFGKPFIVHPGEFVLGCTIEKIKMPTDLLGRLDGRSSLGRLGLTIHSTAGSIDPGFEGNITLEISNNSTVPIAIYPGKKVCRLTFDTLTSPCDITYDKRESSKYKNQDGPLTSKIEKD